MIPIPSIRDVLTLGGWLVSVALVVAMIFMGGAASQGELNMHTIQEASYCQTVLATSERTAAYTLSAQSTLATWLGW